MSTAVVVSVRTFVDDRGNLVEAIELLPGRITWRYNLEGGGTIESHWSRSRD
ncbi:MAG: hypothetical protein R6V19_15790 [Armatimonadota bacterium]